MRILFILLFMAGFSLHVSAQSQESDSLVNAIKKFDAGKQKAGIKGAHPSDTVKAEILNTLANFYWGQDYEKSAAYTNQLMTVSKAIDYKKGVGSAYTSYGVINFDTGNIILSLEFHRKALEINRQIGYKKGMGGSYHEIGMCYQMLGNTPEALSYEQKSLKVKEQMGNKKGMYNTLNSIGIIYKEDGNFKEALKYFEKTLALAEDLKDKSRIGQSYINIGIAHSNLRHFSEALENAKKGLQICLEVGDKLNAAIAYNSIGSTYELEAELKNMPGNYPKVIECFKKARELNEEIGNKRGLLSYYGGMANVQSNQGNYNEAVKNYQVSISIAKETNDPYSLRKMYENLAGTYASMHNYQKAYEYNMLHASIKDSLFNMEKDRKLTQLAMQYDFDKKELATKKEQEKKDAIVKQEISEQSMIRNGFGGGFVIVLLFSLVVLRQRNKVKREKARSEDLLLNILPTEVAEELKLNGNTQAREFEMVTVLFTDFKSFSEISVKMSPSQLVGEIHYCFSAFDNIIHKFGIEKIKTIGDSYMCAGGLPAVNTSHPADVVAAAIEIRDFMLNYKKQKEEKGEIPFEVRIGVHTGPVVAGIVGVKKFAYDIWGDTVNTASRMESTGVEGKVNISGGTYELVKDNFDCEFRGKIEVKGKGNVDMYFAEMMGEK